MKVTFQKQNVAQILKERLGPPPAKPAPLPPSQRAEKQGEERERLELNKEKFGDYSYILGYIDGRIIKTGGNPNQEFYGASMNKPMLALANLILCGDKEVTTGDAIDASTGQRPEGVVHANRPRCLNIKEINGLINYGCRGPDRKDCWGDWRDKKSDKRVNVSNELSRALSGAPYKLKNNITPTKKRAKSIQISLEQIKKVWKELGLKGIDNVHHRMSKNRQSVMGVFKFLSFLNKQAAPYKNQRQKIVNAMKAPFHGHDSKWFRDIAQLLKKFDFPTQSIYGKGGFYGKALNFGIVINNTWIFVVYSNSKNLKERGKTWGRRQLHKILIDALRSPELSDPGLRKGSGHPEYRVGMPKKSTCGLKYVDDIPGLTFIRARKGDYGTQGMTEYLKGLSQIGGGGWIIGDMSRFNCLGRGRNFYWPHAGHTTGREVDICIPMKNGKWSCNIVQRSLGGKTVWDFSRAGGTEVTPETLDIDKALSFLDYTLPQVKFVVLDHSLKKTLIDAAIKQEATDLARQIRLKVGGKAAVAAAHKDHFHLQGVGPRQATRRRMRVTTTRKEQEAAVANTAVEQEAEENARAMAEENCRREYSIQYNDCGDLDSNKEVMKCAVEARKKQSECMKALKEEKEQMSNSKSKLEEHLKKQIKAMLLERPDMIDDLSPTQEPGLALYQEGVGKLTMAALEGGWKHVRTLLGWGGGTLKWIHRGTSRPLLDIFGSSVRRYKRVGPDAADWIGPKYNKMGKDGKIIWGSHNPKTKKPWTRADGAEYSKRIKKVPKIGYEQMQARDALVGGFKSKIYKGSGKRLAGASKTALKVAIAVTGAYAFICTMVRISSQKYWRDHAIFGRMTDPVAWILALVHSSFLGLNPGQRYNLGQSSDDPPRLPHEESYRHHQLKTAEAALAIVNCLTTNGEFMRALNEDIMELAGVVKKMNDNVKTQPNTDLFHKVHEELDVERLTILKKIRSRFIIPIDARGRQIPEQGAFLDLAASCGRGVGLDPEGILSMDADQRRAAMEKLEQIHKDDMNQEKVPPEDTTGTAGTKKPATGLRFQQRCANTEEPPDRESDCLGSPICGGRRAAYICNQRAVARMRNKKYGTPPAEYDGRQSRLVNGRLDAPYLCLNGICTGAQVMDYSDDKEEKNMYIALADGRKQVPKCKNGKPWAKLLTASKLYEWLTGVVPPSPRPALQLLEQLEIPEASFGCCWPRDWEYLQPPGWKCTKINVKKTQ